MATGITWPGSGSYLEAVDTPFEFYTSDELYVTHSVQTAEWSAKRLGYPIMDVELEGKQMYACFEEAVTEYSSIVNQYNIKENTETKFCECLTIDCEGDCKRCEDVKEFKKKNKT